SAVGDAGVADAAAFSVNSSDEINARNNPKGLGNPATRSDVNDFNHNGLVDSSDQILARNNVTNLSNQLKFLVVGAAGPFAPESSGGSGGSDSGVASGLTAALGRRSESSLSAPPGWLALRVDQPGSAVIATISGATGGETASEPDEEMPE